MLPREHLLLIYHATSKEGSVLLTHWDYVYSVFVTNFRDTGGFESTAYIYYYPFEDTEIDFFFSPIFSSIKELTFTCSCRWKIKYSGYKLIFIKMYH